MDGVRNHEPAAGSRAERDPELERAVREAQGGSPEALESVVRAVQDDVYGLALRFLWHPEDAEDAKQEILVRVVTGLRGFAGESAFRTWVYRVAANTLLNIRRSRMEEQRMTFVAFGEELRETTAERAMAVPADVEESLLLEEVKIGCSLGMLLCLDRPYRLAYILGEILDLSHVEAASVLEVTPAAYRKRLSRARAAVTDFMRGHCGLVDPANPCRCRHRLPTAIRMGRIDPEHLLYAKSVRRARAFPTVLEEIRSLEDDQRAVALYRSHGPPESERDFVAQVRGLIARRD